MFVGRWDHSIDEKGRVTLPAPMRPLLGERAYVAKYDGCLALWTEEDFAKVAALMEERARTGVFSEKAVRAFSSSAHQVQLDKAGRISLPERLRDYAELTSPGEVVLAGRLSRLELWAPGRFEDNVSGEDGDEELARELGTLSI